MTREETARARLEAREAREALKARALAALVASCGRGEFCQWPIPGRLALELAEASELGRGIPARTLRRWAKSPEWREAMGAAWSEWHKVVWSPICEARIKQEKADKEARLAATRPARVAAARARVQGWKDGTLAPPDGCYVTEGGAIRRKAGYRYW